MEQIRTLQVRSITAVDMNIPEAIQVIAAAPRSVKDVMALVCVQVAKEQEKLNLQHITLMAIQLLAIVLFVMVQADVGYAMDEA